MERSRLPDPVAGPADHRMAAYLEGRHHPQQSLRPRVSYVALAGDTVLGYIAGHLSRRHACDGELQYLYVASEYRRQGIASHLLRLLAGWFTDQGAVRVCVNVDTESAAAVHFYQGQGASVLSKHWYVWENIATVLEPNARRSSSQES